MNKHFPDSIFKCIYCGSESFSSNMQQSHICNGCSREFQVIEGVHVFLPEKEQENLLHTEIHEQAGTHFRYIDHYQKDAVASDYFEVRDQGTEHYERRVREQIIRQVKHQKAAILDVGCGKAWVASHFCPLGSSVISMDIALRNTSEALKRYPYQNHAAVVADAFNLPFQKDTFDYIIASEIIEHVVNPALFIENLFGLLKPGGKLIVTTPYKEKLQYSLCIHCNKPTPLHAHIHSFDENILTSLHRGEGLRSVSYEKFANKIPIHFRLHPILKHLNFSSWNYIDRMLNKIRNIPTRIMVVWEKDQISK